MSHLHGDSSGMDGREIASLMLRPHVPPEAPRKRREHTDGQDIYEEHYGPPALRETPPRRGEADGRVPFDPGVDFYELRRRAMLAGKEAGRPFGRLLSLLRNCEPNQQHEAEEHRGASYKRLKFLGALCEFGERRQRLLYRLARRAGMSDRFAGHLISEVKTCLAARRAER